MLETERNCVLVCVEEGVGVVPVYSMRVASRPPQYNASAALRRSIIR